MRSFSRVISTRQTVEEKNPSINEDNTMYYERIRRTRWFLWGLIKQDQDLEYECQTLRQAERNGVGFKFKNKE
jgi:hypothetical protein